jgi:Icc protein
MIHHDDITVLQLTDLHLFAEPDGLFNNTNTRDSFRSVLNHVQQHYEKPDLIVLTGDLAHDGKPETYQFISDALRVFSTPVYCVLGNHDNRDSANSVYPRNPITMDLHCVLKHWQIIMLDSNYQPNPESYEGEISEFDLQRMTELATRHSDKSILIATHHNLPEHADRGVAVEVRNHQRVMQHLEQLPNLKAVISGHVHQEFLIVQRGVCYLSTPSTGYQSTSKSGQVTGEAPGYRWLKLYADGRFETDVRRVTIWAS